MRFLFLIAISILDVPRALAAEWQLVLLKPPECNSCLYVEQILKRNLQIRSVELDDGAGQKVTASINRRASYELSLEERGQLQKLPYFDAAAWNQRVAAGGALLLLKRDGVIASAADISDSANLRDVQVPLDLTSPSVGRSFDSVREARSKFVFDLYMRSWNLNWLYQLALKPELALRPEPLDSVPGQSASAIALSSANIMLLSTASGAADNEIFNALRIEEISQIAKESVGVTASQLQIFYGGGNVQGASALEWRDGQIRLTHRTVAEARPFTSNAATNIFRSIRAQPGSRNLLVLIGHGNPEGAGLWGSPVPLSPKALRSLSEQSGGDNVMVSGNCFGGVMARATSCGFFGARPDVVATGCQADAAEVAQSRDYLHMYFSGLKPVLQSGVDLNGDKKVSFAEAHWHASLKGDPRNVPYTSIDAMADAFFDDNSSALPNGFTAKAARALANETNRMESGVLLSLLEGFADDTPISLQDFAQWAERWSPTSAAPRTLTGQLVRRLLFLKRSNTLSGELAQLHACENRAIADFLRP